MQKTKRAIEVVAALIVRGDRFLACQRPPEKARGLLWEFVGGKVEAGESGPEALVRECREELDVVLSVGEAIMDVTHAYPDLTVHLTLYRSRIAQGEPKLIEHHDFRWITAEEIGDYEFCPADQVFLEEIRRKGLA
ncbi:MAG: (deoxy)nucleoside triphosphate pyrophosphohydrolase [Clostridia bacterium]|nr:(deoxy)nucleoside triphosphate pyrophosphohydrolase [Clostridia bacterium]